MKQVLVATTMVAALFLAQAQQAPEPAASTPSQGQLSRLCDGCAWVQGVHIETRKGKASGLGAVGGAVIGGLLGNQVGGDTGKKIVTLGGGAAGGYAGHEAEKKMNETPVWVVDLVNKDGSARRVELGADPDLRTGDSVREQGGQLVRA